MTGKARSQSSRAGLMVPVGRVRRRLQTGGYVGICSPTASVFLASVMEYVTREWLDVAIDVTDERKRSTITPRILMMAKKTDVDLDELLRRYHVCSGGVVPVAKDARSAARKKKAAAATPA